MGDPLTALDKIAERAGSDPAWLDASQAEDVHHFVETALVEYLGPLGFKLHTGRSRNELVATDFRIIVKEASHATRPAVARPIAARGARAASRLAGPITSA